MWHCWRGKTVQLISVFGCCMCDSEVPLHTVSKGSRLFHSNTSRTHSGPETMRFSQRREGSVHALRDIHKWRAVFSWSTFQNKAIKLKKVQSASLLFERSQHCWYWKLLCKIVLAFCFFASVRHHHISIGHPNQQWQCIRVENKHSKSQTDFLKMYRTVSCIRRTFLPQNQTSKDI